MQVQVTPQDSKQGQSECGSSAAGEDRFCLSRQNRFTKAGSKNNIQAKPIRSQSSCQAHEDDNLRLNLDDIMLANHQKSVGNSAMKTLNHVNVKKLKIQSNQNYLNKTLSSQAKIVEKNSKSRTRASSIVSKEKRSQSRSNTVQKMTLLKSGEI